MKNRKGKKKESLQAKARNNYGELSYEEKDIKREYERNRYRKMLEEDNQN